MTCADETCFMAFSAFVIGTRFYDHVSQRVRFEDTVAGVTRVTFYNNISKQYGGGMDILVNVTDGVETCIPGLGFRQTTFGFLGHLMPRKRTTRLAEVLAVMPIASSHADWCLHPDTLCWISRQIHVHRPVVLSAAAGGDPRPIRTDRHQRHGRRGRHHQRQDRRAF